MPPAPSTNNMQTSKWLFSNAARSSLQETMTNACRSHDISGSSDGQQEVAACAGGVIHRWRLVAGGSTPSQLAALNRINCCKNLPSWCDYPQQQASAAADATHLQGCCPVLCSLS
eukprot:GHRQ01027492.1.p3 GENE.GHRQ01027492.1~~GHRQ01027492.1.p3  ORF type:complete len:115 (+),score=23.74 GHRQ01027492.1:755-1099(+)